MFYIYIYTYIRPLVQIQSKDDHSFLTNCSILWPVLFLNERVWLLNSPAKIKLREELQPAPLWVPAPLMRLEQNLFYNHFPFHFLSSWPKPLWRVACFISSPRLGHHLCPSFVDRMFNQATCRVEWKVGPGVILPRCCNTSALESVLTDIKMALHYPIRLVTNFVSWKSYFMCLEELKLCVKKN